MPRGFGYTVREADDVRTCLDVDLKGVEFRLEQIAKRVPHAGATTARLDEAKEITQSVVSDLHDVITERTDSGRPPSASEGGGSGAGDPGHVSSGFRGTGSKCEPSGAASTSTDSRGGDADASASGVVGAPEAASPSGAGAASVSAFADRHLRNIFGFDYWDEPGIGSEAA